MTLRYNNNGEYESNEFIDFYRYGRIKRDMIVWYYTKKNGTVGRKNWTIMEVVKVMPLDLTLSMFIWAEATRNVAYVKNRFLHWVLDYNTLEEVFRGKRINVEHLTIFGYLVFVHKPKEKTAHLEPFGKNGTFFGYNENSMEFMVYFPGKWYTETCNYVIFNEDVLFLK